ncbi:MAG: T9SS type A sorting domain-containing protein [Saprospiraceae bacterium]|nr:T9SS type A sorting domain-containing protein [Saprospiraceae bacterium]
MNSQQALFSNLNQIPGITQAQINGINQLPRDTTSQFTLIPNYFQSPILDQPLILGLPGPNGLQYVQLEFSNIGQGYMNATAYYGSFSLPNRGDIILQSSNGFVSGIIQFNSDNFLITPAGDGHGVIIRLDNVGDSFGKINCQDIPERDSIEEYYGQSDDPGGPCFKNSECPAELTIVVVLNESGQQWCESFGTVNWFGTVNIGSLWLFNQFFFMGKSFINSQINSTLNIKFTSYNGINFTSSATFDLNTINNNNNIWELQKTMEADIILFCPNVNYQTANGIVQGIASAYGPVIDKAFGIIDISFVVSAPQLVAHEIGHLLGGRHRRNNDPLGQGYCNHAHLFFLKNNKPYPFDFDGFVTCVATPSSTGLEISAMHYSNPRVKVGSYINSNFQQIDVYTGTDADDNAGIINENICNVSKANIYADMSPYYYPIYKKVCVEDITFEQCISVTIPPSGRALQPGYSVFWYWNNVPETPHNYTNSNEHFIDLTFENDNEFCLDVPISSIPQIYGEFYICAQIIEDLTGEYITLISGRMSKDHTTNCTHTTGIVRKASNNLDKSYSLNDLIESSNKIDKTYEIYNLEGRSVYIGSLGEKLEFIYTNLNTGIYIIKEMSSDYTHYQKIIINGQ